MHPDFALVSLGHSQAPCKSLGRLVESHPATVEAIHSTDHPEHPIGLPALAITRHRISHGWGIQALHEAGVHFWFRLTEQLV
jgi:hypothetical protein